MFLVVSFSLVSLFLFLSTRRAQAFVAKPDMRALQFPVKVRLDALRDEDEDGAGKKDD